MIAIILRTQDRPILLARALCGILGQTCADWRLVLVDTGAPGPVGALVETYAMAFGDRLTLLRGAAPDQAAALGFAHPHARAADYVALHDDDDAWHPEFLRDGLDYLGSDAGAGCVAVACHGWLVEERMVDGGVVEEARQPGFSEPHPLELARLLGSAGVPPICLLMRRTALDRLRETDRLSGDEAGLSVALLFEGEIGVIPRRLAFVYRRTGRAGPYANRSSQAEAADVLRRNRLLRAAGNAGIVPALGASLAPALQAVNDLLERNGGWGHGRHADTQARLIRLEAAITALQRDADRIVSRLGAMEPMLRLLERARRWFAWWRR